MDFLSKLSELMRLNGMNKMSLAQLSGIPYTTIDGLYKKGYANTKLSTLKKLSQALNVSIDFLADDELSMSDLAANAIAEGTVTAAEKQLLTDFRSLNEEGQEKSIVYVKDLVASGRYIKISEPTVAQEA